MISVNAQVEAYAHWAKAHGRKRIAVFPMRRTGHTVEARLVLLAILANCGPYACRVQDIARFQDWAKDAGFSFPAVSPADYDPELYKKALKSG